MNLRCFELHRYHRLGQFRELWHLFLFVLSFVLFLCRTVVGRKHLQVTEASKASQLSKAPQASKVSQASKAPQVTKAP